jgi:hypothetical protein
MARDPVDLGTPSGRGVWLDRPSARRLSYPDNSAGDPALWAARYSYLLAGHADAPSAEALPTHTATDIVMPQVWGYLPEDAKQAFGSRFSQIVVRVVHDLRTSEGSV